MSSFVSPQALSLITKLDNLIFSAPQYYANAARVRDDAATLLQLSPSFTPSKIPHSTYYYLFYFLVARLRVYGSEEAYLLSFRESLATSFFPRALLSSAKPLECSKYHQ